MHPDDFCDWIDRIAKASNLESAPSEGIDFWTVMLASLQRKAGKRGVDRILSEFYACRANQEKEVRSAPLIRKRKQTNEPHTVESLKYLTADLRNALESIQGKLPRTEHITIELCKEEGGSLLRYRLVERCKQPSVLDEETPSNSEQPPSLNGVCVIVALIESAANVSNADIGKLLPGDKWSLRSTYQPLLYESCLDSQSGTAAIFSQLAERLLEWTDEKEGRTAAIVCLPSSVGISSDQLCPYAHDLARGPDHWDAYHEPLSGDVSRDQEIMRKRNRYGLYVSGTAVPFLGCRFSLEPVGELRVNGFESFVKSSFPIIYRAWGRLIDIDSLGKHNLVQKHSSPVHGIVDYEAGNLIHSQTIAVSLLEGYLKDSSALVLHWQCHHSRKDDLLAPIEESLRPHLDFNRRREGDLSPIDTAKDWLKRRLSSVTEHERNSFASFLVGSRTSKDFANLPHVLSRLLLESQVRVVVENWQWADESLRNLLSGVERAIHDLTDTRLDLSRITIDPASISLAPDLDELDRRSLVDNPDLHDLLAVAAALGINFLLSWLRFCWIQLAPAERNGESFRQTLDTAYQRGYLKFSSLLADSNNPGRRYRKVQFASAWFFEQLQSDIVVATKRQQVHRIFMVRFQKYAAEKGVDKLRSKIHIFRIAKEAVNHPHTEINCWRELSELALIVGVRASATGAYHEALNRLYVAFKWSDRIEEVRDAKSVELRLGIAMHIGSTMLYMPPHQPIEEQAIQCFKEVLKSDSDGPTGEEPFETISLRKVLTFYRTWAGLCLWNESLSDAYNASSILKRIATNKQRHDVVMEANHLLSVALFQQGKFEESANAAREGRLYCEGHAGLRPNDPEQFGNHDGRVCCKAFEALSTLIMEGESKSSQESITRLLEFCADTHNDGEERTDPVSRNIGYGYAALYYFLLERYVDAKEILRRVPKIDEGHHEKSRWDLFIENLSICARIGENWQLPAENQRSWAPILEDMDKARSSWKPREHSLLWRVFSAVAKWHIDREDSFRQFDEIVSDMPRRQERYFNPQIYRFYAWFREHNREYSISRELLKDGLELSVEIKSLLFQNRLQDELNRMTDIPSEFERTDSLDYGT